MSAVRHLFWKELKLYLWPAGRPSKQTLVQWAPGFFMMIPLAIIFGTSGDSDGMGFRFTVFLPFLLILMAMVGPANLAADSFAGERERHTLETVLTGPITPRQLLWGKALAQLALMGIGAAFALVLSLIVLLVVQPTAAELAILIVGLPFAIAGSLVFGLMMLLMSTLASVQSPTVKATSSKMMVYFLVAFGIGLLPSTVLVPLILLTSRLVDDLLALSIVLIGLQALAGLTFLGYLGYLFHRLMVLTRADRFKIEV